MVTHDPIGAPQFKERLGYDIELVHFTDNWSKAVVTAAVIALVTAWDEYPGLSGIRL